MHPAPTNGVQCLVPYLLTIVLLAAPTMPEAPPSPTVAKYVARHKAAKARRNVGWALAAVGVAAMASGVILAVYGATEVDINRDYDTAIADVVSGSAAAAVGLALFIPGVVFALQGQLEMTDTEWRIKAALQTAFVAPTRSGIVLGASFRF
jgi:hypothetical protein